MSNPSKYNFPNAQKVQIFEQVDQYIEHNHAADPEVKSPIARPQTDRLARSLTLFFSYAHKDEALRDQLATHLALLKRQGIIATWHDRDISAGTEWAEAIATHLHTADIILLLISANFLASDYCYDTEMQQALQRHDRGQARVIPILLKPCDWETSPFGKLQALPIAHGAGAKPITQWADLDEAFTKIAQGIRQAADLTQRKQPSVPSTSVLSESAIVHNFHIHQVGNFNAGDVTIQGNQIGETPKL